MGMPPRGPGPQGQYPFHPHHHPHHQGQGPGMMRDLDNGMFQVNPRDGHGMNGGRGPMGRDERGGMGMGMGMGRGGYGRGDNGDRRYVRSNAFKKGQKGSKKGSKNHQSKNIHHLFTIGSVRHVYTYIRTYAAIHLLACALPFSS